MLQKKIFLNFILILIIITPIHSTGNEIEYGKFKPSIFSKEEKVVLVSWNSKEGIKRLSDSHYKNDFYQMAHNFQPQINPLYCGIATSVILLNTMRIPMNRAPSQKYLEVLKPKVWGGETIPFPAYSQLTFLNDKTDDVKPRDVINLTNITRENTNDESKFDPGLSLAQLKAILELYDVNVELKYADKDVIPGSKLFRNDIKVVLKENKRFLIVNFVGHTIGSATGGHISPLAAYDEHTDSVLVLDVAGHKNPWYWVPVEHLYQSMHQKDSGFFRGWLIIKDTLNHKE